MTYTLYEVRIMKKLLKNRLSLLTGILAAIALIVVVGVVKPASQSVFETLTAKAEKKLPIYCVKTDDKKVAISFDAAWGELHIGDNGKIL